MRQRLDWVDITKGFAIIAVVLLHIDFPYPHETFKPVMAMLGGGWHVAVFFLIGGFFIKEEKLIRPIEFMRSKVKGLYLPTLYIYVGAVLLHNVLLDIGWYDSGLSYSGKTMSELTPPPIC